MTDDWAYQYSFADLGLLSGKTCQEHSVQTKGKTSKQSSRSSSASSNQMRPMFLCLRREGGASADACTMRWDDGVLPMPYTMLSGGEFHKDERGSLWSQISTDSQHSTLSLSLRCGEMPDEPMDTKLSQILETQADSKYYLSQRACQGILNRAAKRGKVLPEILKTALENQMNQYSNAEDPQRM